VNWTESKELFRFLINMIQFADDLNHDTNIGIVTSDIDVTNSDVADNATTTTGSGSNSPRNAGEWTLATQKSCQKIMNSFNSCENKLLFRELLLESDVVVLTDIEKKAFIIS
jgi:hypothetical protein